MIDSSRIRIEKFFASNEAGKPRVDLLRLDLVHPVVSGNKWYKLSPYLEDAAAKGKKTVVTRGGAWSNHILATAYACRQLGMHCKLIIRGERPINLSDTLLQALQLNAELVFLPRHLYRDNVLPRIPGIEDAYIIPEGGCGEPGIAGAATLAGHFDFSGYDMIACAAGTGTTAAGLLRTISPGQKLLVVPVLKGAEGFKEEVLRLSGNVTGQMEVFADYHFGGYARMNDELIHFMNAFYRDTGVPSDFVYTGKLFYAINDLVQKNHFRPSHKILVIHSGGLQGNRSLEKGKLIFEDL